MNIERDRITVPADTRREAMKRGSLLAALAGTGLLFASRPALASIGDLAFDATSMQEVLRALGGRPALGAQISINLAEVVDNGAVVPLTVNCSLPGVREIAVVVENNPNPLAARFSFPEGTEPFVSTRVKMAESSRVYVVVSSQGGMQWAAKDVQVVVGGCG